MTFPFIEGIWVDGNADDAALEEARLRLQKALEDAVARVERHFGR